ncbi:hypothetical protein PMAYCL1PPCAC_07512, partial [Pristionchus mayeri]
MKMYCTCHRGMYRQWTVTQRSKINLDARGLRSSHCGTVTEGVEGRGRRLLLIFVFSFFSLILDLLRLSSFLLSRETSAEISPSCLEGFLTRGIGLSRCGFSRSGDGCCSGSRCSCDCSRHALLLAHHSIHPHSDSSPLGADVGDEVVFVATVSVLVLQLDSSSDVEGSSSDEVSAHVDLLRDIQRTATEKNTLSIGGPAHSIEDVGVALASYLSISAPVSTGSARKGSTLCLNCPILVDCETVDDLREGAFGSPDGSLRLCSNESCEKERRKDERTHLKEG